MTKLIIYDSIYLRPDLVVYLEREMKLLRTTQRAVASGHDFHDGSPGFTLLYDGFDLYVGLGALTKLDRSYFYGSANVARKWGQAPSKLKLHIRSLSPECAIVSLKQSLAHVSGNKEQLDWRMNINLFPNWPLHFLADKSSLYCFALRK